MSKFKVGDKVKIVRRVDRENGWENSWVGDMDQYIGTIHTVHDYDNFDGYKLDNISYGWPESALELYSGQKFKVGDRVRVVRPSGLTKTSSTITWLSSMERFVDQIGTITRIEGSIYYRINDFCDYVFDESWLVPVSDEAKFKKGDKVNIFQKSSWIGFVSGMQKYVSPDAVYTIVGSHYNTGHNQYFYTIEEDESAFYFPEECFRVVNLKEENNMNKFKKGDSVKIVRRVDEENGWENVWTDAMDQCIGTVQTICESKPTGYKFEDIPYRWPESALLLVKNNNPKYQYLRSESGDLCLTISTIINKNSDGEYSVDWGVAFKNPKDKFSKADARAAVESKKSKNLQLGKHYTRYEIVTKILADLLYNDVYLSDTYKVYIRYLLASYSYNLLYVGK